MIMKKVFGVTTKLLVVASVVVFSVFAVGCKKDTDTTPASSGMYTISGNASGSQMVPAVSGNGTGTITGTFNANTGVLTYTTNWAGLSGAPTSGAFYTGASGSSGTLVGSSWNMGAGLSSTGTYSGQVTLTADQATQLKNGNWYYTLSTANNPNGEIRGQIVATPK